MLQKMIIFLAFVLYLIPLYFSVGIFAIENVLYAAMLLSMSFFIGEPYKKWFRRIGTGMAGVVLMFAVWVLFVYLHIPDFYFP